MRNILKIIPTDPKLLESFDKITNKITSQTATANSTNSSIFETSSSSSLNTSIGSNKDSSLKRNESFSNFDAKIYKDFSYFFNKDIPLHRILYNLEVNFSRLEM